MGWKEHFCPAFQKSSLPAGGHSLSPSGWCPSGLQIVLVDDREWPMGTGGQVDAPPTPPPTPVDLDLDWVLGKMPQKVRGGRRHLPSLARPHPLPHTCLVTCMPSAPPRCSHPCWSVSQEFFLQRSLPLLQPLTLPPGLSVRQALARVLRLPAVASKRYLTNKVLPAPCSTPLALCAPPSACPPQERLWGSIREGEGSGQKPRPLLPPLSCMFRVSQATL